MSELTAFRLNGADANDDQLIELAKQPRLKAIELAHASRVTERGLAAIRDRKELTHLSRLAPRDIDAARFLPSLVDLNRDSTPCQSEHLAAPGRLKVTALALRNTGTDHAAAAQRSGMTTVTQFFIHTNLLTGEGLAALKPLKALNDLDLTGSATTAAGIQGLHGGTAGL